ncbi:RagB/SusD family nutrient uptake outer membrane protein [Parapedobacter tibetensis]|uniref:RagB/SusD family nutrient uptake outer membrane protein n=1 Tax=Parapedobacter tibetensis TaxID=2972951 RepID=UPI00214D720C|nr:RagB/SusD family nutrient uptake outer membrane protein [Parapedobacter tibetensis]
MKNLRLQERIKPLVLIGGMIFLLGSCKYLDVVPEGVSTIDNAFSMRNQAIKYLYTCYSYMPKDGNIGLDPALMSGDEVWAVPQGSGAVIPFNYEAVNIALGAQNASSPLIHSWNSLYQGIRTCNIFLENIGNVPDLEDWERYQWVSEVKVLKAYYHFRLLRMYGPIPVIKVNLPIDASEEDVRVARDPVDSCVSYIVQLLDESVEGLPITIASRGEELGRITKPIALALKARVLVTAASPLFNGNADQTTLRNPDGTVLFNQGSDAGKWVIAAQACKDAIDVCVGELGMGLYAYPGNPQFPLSDTILTELTLRNAFAERWNDDIIWANTQSLSANLQQNSAPKLDIRYIDYSQMRMLTGAPIKIAEQFYSNNGVPIREDRDWDYSRRFEVKTATVADNRYIRQDYQTAYLNFKREPRFYANLGFDGGIWYGQGVYDDRNPSSLYYMTGRKGQMHGAGGSHFGPITGYQIKKWIHFENVQISLTSYSIRNYAWPLFRLSDLFLLYAEALNEAANTDANRTQALEYVDMVRERAGLKSVNEAWTQHSTNPDKFRSQEGLRQIIHQERLNELCFEGQRFWDIRRWKTLADYYGTPIQGWDLQQADPAYYYRPRLVFRQEYRLRDYFWPIAQADLTVNPNMVQNIGW